MTLISFDQLSALAQLFCCRLCVLYLGFVVLFLVFCILKLIGFVSAIHSEDSVTLCLSSLWMAQCNITLYIVVFNLDKKNSSHI